MKSKTGLKTAFARGPKTGTLEMTGNPALTPPTRLRVLISTLPLQSLLCGCELFPFKFKLRLSPAHGRARLADEEFWVMLKPGRPEQESALVTALEQHMAAIPILRPLKKNLGRVDVIPRKEKIQILQLCV